MIDTMDINYEMTQAFQDELHRPMFPYKFKLKTAGCAVDCIASVARADLSVVGTWKGDIQIDQAEVANYAKGGMNIQAEIVDMCPTGCVSYDGKALSIDNANCSRCMHCIAKMTKALRPGKERGATILVGSKAPFVIGALLSHVIVPFMPLEPPYDNLKDLITKMWEWWDEHGKNRERIGELIVRRGMREFLEHMELDPIPQMIFEPRRDPFYFWTEDELSK